MRSIFVALLPIIIVLIVEALFMAFEILSGNLDWRQAYDKIISGYIYLVFPTTIVVMISAVGLAFISTKIVGEYISVRLAAFAGFYLIAGMSVVVVNKLADDVPSRSLMYAAVFLIVAVGHFGLEIMSTSVGRMIFPR